MTRTVAPLPTRAQRSARRARVVRCAVGAWFTAASAGDIARLTRLVRSGEVADVNSVDGATGRTALHVLISEVSELGATEVNAVAAALFELARGVGGATEHFRHREDLAAALFAAADVDGNTALHLLAERSGTADEAQIERIAEKLVAMGTPVTAKNRAGRLAAEVAAEGGSSSFAAFLNGMARR